MEEDPALPMHPGTMRLVAQLTRALGYDGNPSFMTAVDLDAIGNHRHALARAFDAMGVSGCFGFISRGGAGRGRFSPALYVAATDDEARADEIHRLVWSQGIVPLLLVGFPGGVQLREAYRFERNESRQTVPWDEALSKAGPGPILSRLTARRLTGSLAWRDFTPRARDRVDMRLMKAISGLSVVIRQGGNVTVDRPDLVNALIGRMIYLFVLIDRGTIDQAWISGLVSGALPACPDIKLHDGYGGQSWPASQVWTLFDALDDELNGSVFPISIADRECVSEAAINTVRRVIRHGDTVAGAEVQAGFLDVSFGELRTETISAMYELFLKLEESNSQDADGAFYTPPFLADYVLDELEGYAPLDAGSRVLDPAAGSGIFLVGCFRRIAEASAPVGGWSMANLGLLRELLTRCIYGVERQRQAANVARFSLYLTLLDYAGRASLPDIRASLGGERLFPTLEANVAVHDFFGWGRDRRSGATFTHVVGNPPWGSLKKAGDPAAAYAASLRPSDHPIDNGRVEEAFAWKIISEHARPSGAVALLMSTRCFVNPSARRFPSALASAVTVVGITNLSHFRYRLFAGARSPATAAFLRVAEADSMAAAWVHVPLLSSQPLSVRGDPWSIIASNGSMSHARHAELRSGSWSRLLMLSPYDRRYAALVVDGAAEMESNLGAFLRRTSLMAGRGGTPGQTGVRKELILGGNPDEPDYYRRVLGLETGGAQSSLALEPVRYSLSHDDIAGLRAPYDRLFAGDMLVITRHMVDFDVVERPAAFKSTLNIIAFSTPAPPRERPHRRMVLDAIARYLKSALAKYLFALVGRTWLLDGRRLEINDLSQLPFPFDDVEDLLAGSSDDPVRRLVERLGIEGLGFEAAVAQYVGHRVGYKDSQVPGDAQSKPTDGIIAAYVTELEKGLGAMLGPEARLVTTTPSETDDFASITVAISLLSSDRREGEPPAAALDAGTGEFNSDCIIQYDAMSSTAKLTKPLTMAAWTLDKAYADRMAIINRIVRS